MININKFRKENLDDLANVWDFDNINDLLKVVEIPMSETDKHSRVYSKSYFDRNKQAINSYTLSSNTEKGIFYFDTFDEALKALKYGWEDGRCQLRAAQAGKKIRKANIGSG